MSLTSAIMSTVDFDQSRIGRFARRAMAGRTGSAPEVQHALKESYPVDRAVGFAEGEVRGWFWVELPKRQAVCRQRRAWDALLTTIGTA